MVEEGNRNIREKKTTNLPKVTDKLNITSSCLSTNYTTLVNRDQVK